MEDQITRVDMDSGRKHLNKNIFYETLICLILIYSKIKIHPIKFIKLFSGHAGLNCHGYGCGGNIE